MYIYIFSFHITLIIRLFTIYHIKVHYKYVPSVVTHMEDQLRNSCELFNPVHTTAATKLYRSTNPPIVGTQLHHAFRYLSDEIKQISSNCSYDLTDISKGISSTPLSKSKTAPAKNARDNQSQLNLANELLKKKPALVGLLMDMFPGDELEFSIFRTNSTFNFNGLVNKNKMIEYLADNFTRLKDPLKGNPFTYNDSTMKWEATNDYNYNDFPTVSILEKRHEINTNMAKFFFKKKANFNPSNNTGKFFDISSVSRHAFECNDTRSVTSSNAFLKRPVSEIINDNLFSHYADDARNAVFYYPELGCVRQTIHLMTAAEFKLGNTRLVVQELLELLDDVCVIPGAIFKVDRVSTSREANDEGVLLVGSFTTEDNDEECHKHLPGIGKISLRHKVFLEITNDCSPLQEFSTPPEVVLVKRSK